MSSTLSFTLNEEPIKPPVNWKEATIDVSFDSESPSATISSTNFEFVNENIAKIQKWRDGGLNGTSPGIFEGIPLRIDLECEEEGQINLLNGFLNLSAADAKYDCNSYLIPAMDNSGLDNFRDQSDTFSFAYLYKKGVIKKSDFVKVYYVINRIPDFEQAALLYSIAFLIVRETADAIYRLADAIKEAITAIDPGALLRAAAKVLMNLIYFAAVALALINLLKQMVNALFPIPKYYYGMRARTLFQRGCEFMGLGFKSTILENEYKDLVILPPKFQPGKNIINKSDDVGFPEKTFGQWIDSMVDLFNARVKVVDGILLFERRDQFSYFSGFTVKRVPGVPYGTNASEVAANFLLRFLNDSDDANTIVGNNQFAYQVTVEPITIGNKANITLKNLDERVFPFAKAIRKASQSKIEKLFATVFDLVNKFLGLIKGSGALPKIGNRVGFMVLNNDFFSVDKLLIISNTEGMISKDSDTKLSAQAFWDKFHYINSPVPTSTSNGNQWVYYKDVEVHMCCGDLKKVIGNNIIYIESEGSEAVVESIKYNIFEKTAKLDYKINRIYTKNLREVKP